MAVQRDFRMISNEEADTVRRVLKIFSELTLYRNIHAGQWEEAAILIDPDSRNTFYYGSYNFPGIKKTQQQVDASGALALQQFCAIADSMITPKNRHWHGLQSDEYVMKDRASREYFDQVTKILFDYRYRTGGGFHGQNYRIWKSLGAFGNSIMYVDGLDTRRHPGQPGLRYRAVPLGECFFAEDHQGRVNTIVRWWRMTAQNCLEKFGAEWVPPNLWPALDTNQQTPYQFLHYVGPRDPNEFDPERLDAKGTPWCSYYVSVEGQCLLPHENGEIEGGYREFPYAVSRYDQMPGEVYGRGPAQLTLPGLKTLNAQKGMFLKVGHRLADPVFLTADDGLVSWNLIPGATNPGGLNADGKPLLAPLNMPQGGLEITEKMMLEERGLIENMFLTPLFKTLMQNPNMTATQVVELINERAMLVAPTLGRQHSEYAGGLVPREVSLLSRMRVNGRPILPPMPPRLREAQGHYEVTDTSPLALQAKSSQAAGTMRTLDIAHQVAINTGDASIYDYFAFERIIPDLGEINEMPTRHSATAQEVAAKQKNRQAQAERQAQIQALPAQAAMIKAQAAASKQVPFGQQPQPQQQVPA